MRRATRWPHGCWATPPAKREGRISLNPFRHFDLVGTLCMIFARGGLGKACLHRPPQLQKPQAGHGPHRAGRPGGQPLLAYLAHGGWKLYYWAPTNEATIFLARFLQYLVYLDVSLAVFNLIPVPPLDGSRVLLAVLPERIYFQIMRYERVILIVLLAAVWGGFLDGPLCVINDVAGICWISAPATSTRSPILRIMHPSGR